MGGAGGCCDSDGAGMPAALCCTRPFTGHAVDCITCTCFCFFCFCKAADGFAFPPLFFCAAHWTNCCLFAPIEGMFVLIIIS